MDRKELIRDINISDGFSLNDAYIMIYNALQMPCIEFDYTNGVIANPRKTETLGKKYFNIEFVEGRCTATEKGTIYGSKVATKKLAIDGKEYFCELQERYSLLGLYTEAVINEEGTIISLRPVEKDNKITVIAPEDFDNYDGSKITYYKGSSQRTIKLNDAVIIYNGANVTGSQFSKELFDFSEGSITVITSKDGKNDVISIESWSNFIVGSKLEVSTNAYEIGASNITGTYITLDFEDYATLKNTDGESCDISELKKGMLITYKATLDGRYVDAIISQNVVEGNLEEKNEDELTIGGVTYSYNKEMLEGKVSFNDFNTVYLWYINPFGIISAVDYSGTSGVEKGYVINAYVEMFESGFITIVDNAHYDKSNSVTFALKSKLKIDGETKTASEAVAALNANEKSNIPGKAVFPIFYLLNENGEVKWIDTPVLGEKEDPKTSLREIILTGRYDSNGWLYAKTDSAYKNAIEHTYILPSTGTLIYYTEDLSEVYTAEKLLGDRYYDNNLIRLYTEGDDTVILDFIVYLNNDGEQPSVSYEQQFWIVDEVLTVIDEEDSITKGIECTSNGQEYKYLVNTSLYEKNSIPGMDTLAKGDIVRFSFDTKGKVNGMSKLVSFADRNASTGWRLTPSNDHVLKYDYNREYRPVFGKIYDIEYSSAIGKYIVTYYVDGPDDLETVYYNGSEFTMYDEYYSLSVDSSAIKTYKEYGTAADNIFLTTVFCNVSQLIVFQNQK